MKAVYSSRPRKCSLLDRWELGKNKHVREHCALLWLVSLIDWIFVNSGGCYCDNICTSFDDCCSDVGPGKTHCFELQPFFRLILNYFVLHLTLWQHAVEGILLECGWNIIWHPQPVVLFWFCMCIPLHDLAWPFSCNWMHCMSYIIVLRKIFQ